MQNTSFQITLDTGKLDASSRVTVVLANPVAGESWTIRNNSAVMVRVGGPCLQRRCFG